MPYQSRHKTTFFKKKRQTMEGKERTLVVEDQKIFQCFFLCSSESLQTEWRHGNKHYNMKLMNLIVVDRVKVR